ncbi:hypothetical protein ACFYWS_08595 [Streptomyces sp. NPDC002795]|uniref:hypothetical protein n=1 Tax=Streptomyces sp. NPDC002795 TaxID=3364665 RepID=UPI0036749199
MRATALPLISVLLTAAALCTACSAGTRSDTGKNGSAESPADHAATVRAAVGATRSTSAHTAQQVDLSAGTRTFRISTTGGFDMAADRGELTVRMREQPAIEVREVFAGDDVHVRGASALDAGWGTVPRAKATAHALLRAPLNDPEYLLGQIADLREVSDEGEETVGGVRATHYRGTLDHTTITRRLAADTRKKTDQLRDYLGEDIPVFADVWVDAKGRVVRARTALDLPQAGAKMKVTLNLSRLGAPVKVTVPESSTPAADTNGTFLG